MTALILTLIFMYLWCVAIYWIMILFSPKKRMAKRMMRMYIEEKEIQEELKKYNK